MNEKVCSKIAILKKNIVKSEIEKLTYPLILKYRLPNGDGGRGGLLHWKGILAEFERRKSLVDSLGGVESLIRGLRGVLGPWCAKL